MSELSFTSSHPEGNPTITILHLKGQVDRNTANQILDHARLSHDGGATRLLLDLAGVDMLTSSGLLAIQSVFKLFTPEGEAKNLHQQKGGPYKSPYFKLVCPNPQIQYVLNIAGFLQNIPMYNALDEAVKSFAG